MRAERFGWPLASVKRTEWFIPENQQWRQDAPWDSGLRLAWGTVLNPLIVGAGVWLAAATPLAARAVVVEQRRRRAGRCLRCGYPVGVSAVCTECGAEISEGEGVRG